MKRLTQLLATALVGAVATVANALNYNASDLLLVMHQPGSPDVLFNLGPAANFTGLPAGTVITNTFDTNVVATNFGSLTGFSYAIVGENDASSHVWMSSADLGSTPADLTLNTYSTLQGKINNVGLSAKLITGGNGDPLVIDPSDFSSYSYIVSPGDAASVSVMGGDAPVTVSAAAPGQLALIQYVPTTGSPLPSAIKLGTFALQANGLLTFTASAVTPVIVRSTGLGTSAAVNRGGSTTLSVTAEGATGYQWYYNGVALAGQTGSSLTLSNVQPGSIGNYSVTVFNGAYGTSVASSVRNLRVTPAYQAGDALLVFHDGINNDVVFNLGSISNFLNQAGNTTQPLNYNQAAVLANFGGSLAGVRVALVAANDPAATVWMSDADLFSIPTDLTLNTYATLAGKIDNAGVVAGGIVGSLDYNNPLVIAPGDLNSYSSIVSPGDAASVDSFGGDAPFQVGTPVSGVSPAVLPLYALHPTVGTPGAASFIGYFNLPAGGSNLTFTASTPVTPEIISTVVADQTIPVGGTATTFTVSARYASGYQWKRDGSNIPGATGNAYTLTAAQLADGGTYSVVALNSAYGTSATSPSTAAVTVFGAPVVTVSPASQTVWQGTNVTLTVAATNAIVGAGSNPNYAYQWQLNGTNVPGATSSNYVIAAAGAADAGPYSVIVSNLAGSATSATGTLVVSLDANAPLINIVLPKALAKVAGTNNANAVIVTGNAKDDRKLVAVKYSLNGAPFANALLVNTNWSVANLPFVRGTNTLAVKSVDLAGNESPVATRQYIYTAYTTFTQLVSGNGTVTPNLNGLNLMVGKSYTVSALPGVGSLPSNWVSVVSGVTNIASKAAKLTFAVQEGQTLVANFVTNRLLALAGKYNGLFSESNGVTVASAGFATVTVAAKDGKPATFTAKLKVAGETVSAAGTFYVDGTAENAKPVVLKATTNNLIVKLVLPFDGSDTLTGTVSNIQAGWQADLLADRVLTNTGFAGLHTLVIPGSTNGPAGDGAGVLTINGDGVAYVVGALGDGAVLKQTVPVSKSGQWPFFCAANAATNGGVKVNAGVIMGWLNVSNTSPQGTVSWVKDPLPGDAYYPGGFAVDAEVISSGYTNTAPVFGWTTGRLTLADGNLPTVLSNNVTLSAMNVFAISTNYAAKLKLTSASGSLKGLFKNPANGNLVTPLTGVVLQNSQTARGWFKGTNATGAFLLQP